MCIRDSYEPLEPESEAGAHHDELRLWNQALRAYRAQQWDEADVTLLELQRMHPRELYRAYADKVAAQRRAPVEGWDGVTVFDEK